MARTPAKPAKNNSKDINSKALSDAALQQDQLMKNLMVIEDNYGDGAPYEQEKSIQKTQILYASGATSLLLAGRELVRIKEHTPHGEFQAILKNRLGINPNTARIHMQAAIRFSGMKQITSAAKSQSTLLELLTLDDGDLTALNEGESVAGLTLDDIERMSVSELRKELREHKEQIRKDTETNDKMMARKNKKIDELTKQLEGDRAKVNWSIQTEVINTDIVAASGKVLEQLDILNQLRDDIVNADTDEEDITTQYESMAITYFDVIGQIFDQFNQLASDCEEVFGAIKNKAVAG